MSTTSYVENLKRLRSELPCQPDGTPAGASRTVLHRLVESAVGHSFPFVVVPIDPLTCPNCGQVAKSVRSPYCSDSCRETASFVRIFRGNVADGSIFEPERQVVQGQVLWSVERGGYPLRQDLVPPRVVAKVIEREGGACAVCGAPATEIDHTGSG